MKRIFIPMAALALLSATVSCGSQNQNGSSSAARSVAVTEETVPYASVSNYFIKNTVDSVPEIITSEAEFQKCFGMAAYMGDGGAPATIDFAKENVIVASVPSTDLATEITPVSLKKDDATLVMTCRLTRGERQSYSTRPFVMIAVDKKYGDKARVDWE